MVGVGEGGVRSALARVSVVNYYGNVLLDTFVKVIEKVCDIVCSKLDISVLLELLSHLLHNLLARHHVPQPIAGNNHELIVVPQHDFRDIWSWNHGI
eukprot:jgi/Pico_ML_1/55598/g1264.t1